MGCCVHVFYIQNSGIIVDGCTSLQSEGVYCESIEVAAAAVVGEQPNSVVSSAVGQLKASVFRYF